LAFWRADGFGAARVNSRSYSSTELTNWVANARRVFCIVERAHFSGRAAFESDWGLKQK
jgi:hypothetical protein